MKRISLLKNLVSIIYILSLISYISLIIMLVFWMTSPKSGLNDILGPDTIANKIAIIVFTGGCAFFIYALKIFKKTLLLFDMTVLFDEEVVVNFRQIGRNIFLGFIVTTISSILNSIFSRDFELDFVEITLALIIVSAGLFFYVLGDLVSLAKGFKDENELTV